MMSAEIYLPIDGISLEATDLTNSGISPTGLFTFFVYEKPTYIEVVPFFGDDSAFYNGGYIVPQGKLVHIKNVAQRYNVSEEDINRTILVKAPEWADFLPITWGSEYDDSLMHNLDLFFPEGWEIKAASNVHHYYSVFIYEADKISEIFNSTNDNSLSSNYPEATELSFIGKWKSFEGEIISVSFNEKNQPYFRRFDDNQLVSEGNFTVEENFIVIQRRDTTDMYKLQYAFSTDAQTLVVMKPYSEQAWLLNRISY